MWCFEKRKFPSPSKGNVPRLRRLTELIAAVCRKRKAFHFELESKTVFQVSSRAAASLAKFAVWVTCTAPPLKRKYVGKEGYTERHFPEACLWRNGRSLSRFCPFMKQTFLNWGLQRKGGTERGAGSITVYKLALVVWILWCFWKTYFQAKWCWFMHRKKKNPKQLSFKLENAVKYQLWSKAWGCSDDLLISVWPCLLQPAKAALAFLAIRSCSAIPSGFYLFLPPSGESSRSVSVPNWEVKMGWLLHLHRA